MLAYCHGEYFTLPRRPLGTFGHSVARKSVRQARHLQKFQREKKKAIIYTVFKLLIGYYEQEDSFNRIKDCAVGFKLFWNCNSPLNINPSSKNMIADEDIHVTNGGIILRWLVVLDPIEGFASRTDTSLAIINQARESGIAVDTATISNLFFETHAAVIAADDSGRQHVRALQGVRPDFHA